MTIGRMNKILAVSVAFILALTLISNVVPTAIALNQNDGEFLPTVYSLIGKSSDEIKAKIMVKIASDSLTKVGKLLNALERAGANVSDAVRIYNEAKSLLEEAKSHVENGEYDEAIDDSFQVISKLKNAVSLLKDEDFEALGKIVLESIADREERVATRFLIILEKAESSGRVDPEKLMEIKTKVEEAKEKIGEAKALIESGDLSRAKEKVNEARSLLREAGREFKDLVKSWKTERMIDYLTRLNEKINEFKERFNASSVNPSVKEKIDSLLNRILAKSEHAKELLESGNWVEGMHEAKDILKMLKFLHRLMEEHG